jgi:hypothetical protein
MMRMGRQTMTRWRMMMMRRRRRRRKRDHAMTWTTWRVWRITRARVSMPRVSSSQRLRSKPTTTRRTHTEPTTKDQ